MMGVTAFTNEITPAAWVLFAILFIWQMPHFYGLALLYREDYARGGFAMLPDLDHSCSTVSDMWGPVTDVPSGAIGRLARHLLRMGGADDILDGRARSGDPPRPIRLIWPYTQSELAGMIGGSRQSVNRMLSDFVQEDLLRFEGNELVIPDPGRLARAVSR